MDKKVNREAQRLGSLGGKRNTEAQRQARRNNAEKARAARKLKRDREVVFTMPAEWPEHSPQ